MKSLKDFKGYYVVVSHYYLSMMIKGKIEFTIELTIHDKALNKFMICEIYVYRDQLSEYQWDRVSTVTAKEFFDAFDLSYIIGEVFNVEYQEVGDTEYYCKREFKLDYIQHPYFEVHGNPLVPHGYEVDNDISDVEKLKSIPFYIIKYAFGSDQIIEENREFLAAMVKLYQKEEEIKLGKESVLCV